MAIVVKVQQHKRKDLGGKWFGKTVKTGDVTLDNLAEVISEKNSVTEGDVAAVLKALVKEMKFCLQMGQTVHIDGLGNFHLSVESEMVDEKSDYRIDEHVKRVVCKFTPTAHREQGTGQLRFPICEGVEIVKR